MEIIENEFTEALLDFFEEQQNQLAEELHYYPHFFKKLNIKDIALGKIEMKTSEVHKYFRVRG